MTLSSIYGTAQRPGGTIEIDTEPGFDTGDQFAVPIREKELSVSQGDPPPDGLKRSLRILCIDDDPRIRAFMTDCLSHYKHRVMVAPGGKKGLELFRTATQENQPYEVVITDLGMPEVDGRQVAQIIKAESPKTPVIMLTGWGEMMREDEETAPAADFVVNKPLRMAELNDLLLRMMA